MRADEMGDDEAAVTLGNETVAFCRVYIAPKLRQIHESQDATE